MQLLVAFSKTVRASSHTTAEHAHIGIFSLPRAVVGGHVIGKSGAWEEREVVTYVDTHTLPNDKEERVYYMPNIMKKEMKKKKHFNWVSYNVLHSPDSTVCNH